MTAYSEMTDLERAEQRLGRREEARVKADIAYHAACGSLTAAQLRRKPRRDWPVAVEPETTTAGYAMLRHDLNKATLAEVDALLDRAAAGAGLSKAERVQMQLDLLDYVSDEAERMAEAVIERRTSTEDAS